MLRMAFVLSCLILASVAQSVFAVTLVEDGRPTSLIILSNDPLPCQRMAAQELQYHLKKMTGALVPIVAERDAGQTDDARILVGQSDLLKATGIDTSSLPRETFIIKTIGNVLILAGEDGSSLNPREQPFNSTDVRTGTMYAVYDFLEDELGCRWLWPGETGEVIPKRDTVKVGKLDVQETPKLFQRRLRPDAIERFRTSKGKPAMNWYFPRYMRDHEVEFAQLENEEVLWLKRMRMGTSERIQYGHAFTKWYDLYHDKYPEIFAMQKDGHRGLPDPTYNHAYVKMCCSSDKLIDMLIEQFMAARAKDPDFKFLNACEDDGNGGWCRCDACKALDVKAGDVTEADVRDLGWSGADLATMLGEREDGLPYSLSNRYFTFYNKLARRLREVAPDACVVVYAYDRYKQAPINLKIEPNIIVALIGSNMYPVTDEERKLQIANAMAWRRSGAQKLYFRPNSFSFSPAMGIPWSQARAMGEDFKLLIDDGIVATDFDRLNGFWATAAPTYYVMARLHWDTDLTPDQLLNEFNKSFGPAAPAIGKYFDHWEKVMHDAYTRPDLADVIKPYDSKAGRRGRYRGVHLLLTPEDFAEGKRMLASAREMAKDDPTLLKRIEVLEMGLRHGELAVEQSRFANDVVAPSADTWFEQSWPVTDDLFAERERMLAKGAFDAFWYIVWSMQHGDVYGEHVSFDFADRPYRPLMTPAADKWRFIPDPADEGEKQSWQASDFHDVKDAKKVGAGFFTELWDSQQVVKKWKVSSKSPAVLNGWYQATFDLAGHAVPPGTVIYLPYVEGFTKVWVDGKLVKEATAAEGEADAPITVPIPQTAQSFTVTIKVSSPESGGLWGPAYLAAPIQNPKH